MTLRILATAIAIALAPLPAATQTAPATAASAPTIRPEIAPPLQAAQKALGDKDHAAALQHLQAAEAVAGRTPYETYLLERMRFLAQVGLRDQAGALKALEAALATGQAEAELRPTLMDQASNAAYALKDYAKAARWAQLAIDAGAEADITRLRLAQSLYLQAQHAEAAAVLDALATRQRQAGTAPAEPQLRLQASNQLKLGDEAGFTRTLEALLVIAPTPDLWADRLARLLRQPGFDESLAVNIFRLSRRVGAFQTAAADLEYADLAMRAGYPAEARTVLEAGFAAGRLGQGADAAKHQALRDQARKQADADRDAGDASLLARDAGLAFKSGWAQYTGGRAEAGITLMRQAVAKGWPQVQRGRLGLGLALAASGDLAAARDALGPVRDAATADGLSDLARLMLIAFDGKR